MNIDERLEQLTVNIESLHASVAELHESVQKHDANIEKHNAQIGALITAIQQDAENIRMLAHIAEIQERRLSTLERPPTQ
jgi:peptidoglycan hydrolase CwlO-like protein